MATVRHVTAWAGRTKYKADGIFFHSVYVSSFQDKKILDLWHFRTTYQSNLLPLKDVKDRLSQNDRQELPLMA
jgi:hypothetical protein